MQRKILASISPTLNGGSTGLGGGDLSIRKHYRIAQATEPTSVARYLTTNATHVHSGLVVPMQDPKEFYRGYDNGWGCITQNLDRSSPNFPVKSPYGSPGSVKLLVPPTCFWGGTRFEVPRFS